MKSVATDRQMVFCIVADHLRAFSAGSASLGSPCPCRLPESPPCCRCWWKGLHPAIVSETVVPDGTVSFFALHRSTGSC